MNNVTETNQVIFEYSLDFNAQRSSKAQKDFEDALDRMDKAFVGGNGARSGGGGGGFAGGRRRQPDYWANFARGLEVTARETDKASRIAEREANNRWERFARGLEVASRQTERAEKAALKEADSRWANFVKGLEVVSKETDKVNRAAEREANTRWERVMRAMEVASNQSAIREAGRKAGAAYAEGWKDHLMEILTYRTTIEQFTGVTPMGRGAAVFIQAGMEGMLRRGRHARGAAGAASASLGTDVNAMLGMGAYEAARMSRIAPAIKGLFGTGAAGTAGLVAALAAGGLGGIAGMGELLGGRAGAPNTFTSHTGGAALWIPRAYDWAATGLGRLFGQIEPGRHAVDVLGQDQANRLEKNQAFRDQFRAEQQQRRAAYLGNLGRYRNWELDSAMRAELYTPDIGRDPRGFMRQLGGRAGMAMAEFGFAGAAYAAAPIGADRNAAAERYAAAMERATRATEEFGRGAMTVADRLQQQATQWQGFGASLVSDPYARYRLDTIGEQKKRGGWAAVSDYDLGYLYSLNLPGIQDEVRRAAFDRNRQLLERAGANLGIDTKFAQGADALGKFGEGITINTDPRQFDDVKQALSKAVENGNRQMLDALQPVLVRAIEEGDAKSASDIKRLATEMQALRRRIDVRLGPGP